MSEPAYGDNYPQYGPPYGPQSGPGPSQPVLPTVPMSPAPYGYGQAIQPAYGYVDPLTGQPRSDKSKIIAGLLQLLPGSLFSLGGIGRLYAGNVGLGVAQLVATVIGWISFWCGFALILPWFVSFGCWAWFVIDGIMLLAGRPVDGQGRPLRG